VTRRGGVALLAAAVLAAAGFTYARPVTVFEAVDAARLRLQGVRSGRVHAGPWRLRYLEAGSGEPLVLVHGLGSSAALEWGRLIAPLGRRFHVYAPDLPGFGGSERPAGADYSIPMQVEAVRAFMQAKGIGRARMAGVSMGGWIVARLAGEHPESVERLVLVDAAGMRPVDPAIPAHVLRLLPQDVEGVRRMAATVRHNVPAIPDFVARDILARRLKEEWILRRALESMGAGRDWLDGTLGRADMPVLVVWGKQDALIPVADAARLQAEFPRAEVRVLDGCGHVPAVDCPEAFGCAVLPFLTAAAP
jgi:pimeloyl-ACP methyl ester carboxylesterase